MSRGRALRTGVAFDQRTGFKVRGRRLVEDGERAIWTTRDNADQAHPQRFVNVPPPDGISYRPGPPAMHAIGARVDLSWVMQSDTHELNGDVFQQPLSVLHKQFSPGGISLGCDKQNFFVGPVDTEVAPFTWNGAPLVWNNIPMGWSTPGDADDHVWDGFEFQ